MKTILIKDDTDYLVNLYVESLVDPNGALIAPYHNDPKIEEIEKTLSEIYPYNEMVKPALKYFTNEKNISTLEEVKQHFLDVPEKYFIIGRTDSKFSLLDLSFTREQALKLYGEEANKGFADLSDRVVPAPKNIRVGKRIEISGTNIVGMIVSESEDRTEYVLYLDTPNPVFYVDNSDKTTIFKFMRNNIDDLIKPTLNYYSDTIDEPKVLSEVFIDRGVNNAFEPMRRLKNVKDLNELSKTGFGYYKINTRGYNFKDQ
jgi:hypothetical protein